MSDTKKATYGKAATPPAPSTGSSNLPKFIIGGAVALVAVIAAVVLFWPSDDGGDVEANTGAAAAANSEQEVATVTISGEDLPLPPESVGLVYDRATDEAVGLEAPKLVGQSFDGSEVVIDPADGNAKVIVFAAHWCPHCQAEIPLIQEWIDEGKVPDGVDVYMVSTAVNDTAANYPPSRWVSTEGWTPQVLLDDQANGAGNAGSAATTFGAAGWPTFVMVDAEGNVFQRGSGEIPIEEFDRLVQELAASSGGDAPTTTAAP